MESLLLISTYLVFNSQLSLYPYQYSLSLPVFILTNLHYPYQSHSPYANYQILAISDILIVLAILLIVILIQQVIVVWPDASPPELNLTEWIGRVVVAFFGVPC